MVKAADLGYISTNLQRVPSQQEKKERELERALQNLTATGPPEKLSNIELPESLMQMLGG